MTPTFASSWKEFAFLIVTAVLLYYALGPQPVKPIAPPSKTRPGWVGS
jgi:hypothetical protein